MYNISHANTITVRRVDDGSLRIPRDITAGDHTEVVLASDYKALFKRAKALFEIAENLAEAHHSTIRPSKVHAPTERNRHECSSPICKKATRILEGGENK